MHRLIKAARGQSGWTAIFAVPGMSHFVREQRGHELALIFIDQRAFAGPIVAGFMMLQAEVRHVVAQGQEEMVIPIVTGAKERSGLRDEVLEVPFVLRLHLECGRAVGHNVNEVRRVGAGRQVHCPEIISGNQRRVHEPLQRDWSKLHSVTGRMIHREGGAEFPAGEQAKTRCVGKITRGGVLGIK